MDDPSSFDDFFNASATSTFDEPDPFDFLAKLNGPNLPNRVHSLLALPLSLMRFSNKREK